MNGVRELVSGWKSEPRVIGSFLGLSSYGDASAMLASIDGDVKGIGAALAACPKATPATLSQWSAFRAEWDATAKRENVILQLTGGVLSAGLPNPGATQVVGELGAWADRVGAWKKLAASLCNAQGPVTPGPNDPDAKPFPWAIVAGSTAVVATAAAAIYGLHVAGKLF